MTIAIPCVERVEDVTDTADTTDNAVQYTPESRKAVVIAVANMLNTYADPKHPGLQEPQNRGRRMANTAVLVYPRQGGNINRVGFQFFTTNQTPVDGGPLSHMMGVSFDLEAFEKDTDHYLFNMLQALEQRLRLGQRPDPAHLRRLAREYLLAN